MQSNLIFVSEGRLCCLALTEHSNTAIVHSSLALRLCDFIHNRPDFESRTIFIFVWYHLANNYKAEIIMSKTITCIPKRQKR